MARASDRLAAAREVCEEQLERVGRRAPEVVRALAEQFGIAPAPRGRPPYARREVLDLLRERGPLSTENVARELLLGTGTARARLQRLREDKLVWLRDAGTRSVWELTTKGRGAR